MVPEGRIAIAAVALDPDAFGFVLGLGVVGFARGIILDKVVPNVPLPDNASACWVVGFDFNDIFR